MAATRYKVNLPGLTSGAFRNARLSASDFVGTQSIPALTLGGLLR
jgi:hypothetical protein